jgi:hypothetical protein
MYAYFSDYQIYFKVSPLTGDYLSKNPGVHLVTLFTVLIPQ